MKMKIEFVATDAVIPYQWNNKIHTPEQINRIANSISQFGWGAPILIAEDNLILAGHGRLEAAKKLGLTEVPVIRKAGLTEAQKKAYRIIDNKTASDTSYDLNNLELEVRALEEMGFNTEPFHFEEFKFDAEPEAAPEPKNDGEQKWVGQIKLKCPANDIDNFEADLDDLLKRYEGVTKETKRVK